MLHAFAIVIRTPGAAYDAMNVPRRHDATPMVR
jgi:hypothetical protein